MLQNLKDWFKKPYEGEGKRQVESYIKNRVRVLKGMFILGFTNLCFDIR